MDQPRNTQNVKNNNKVHFLWGPLAIGVGLVIYYLVSKQYSSLPHALYIEKSDSGRFITERAQNNLRDFVRIGKKVTGSSAIQNFSLPFLIREIKNIQKIARSNLHSIQYDVQVASGRVIHHGIVFMYDGIHNLVVKLRTQNSTSNKSLLLNTHFDTFPGSPGAGDSGIMVVIMLEILRVLSTSETPLTHSVIFLFNGAHESGLQGAHAFITQHEWSKDLSAFINLGSMGNGGREVLFQAGPHPWLLNYYKKSALHPHASTVLQELFQGCFIPTDTDFRIFRDYGGNIPGLDFTHTYNGFVYHTKFDKIDLIPAGSYQHTGDNILELTRALANARELSDKSASEFGHVVFHDILGWFMVVYSATAAIFTNVGISLITVILICFSIRLMANASKLTIREVIPKFGLIFIVQTVSMGLAIGMALLLAVIIDAGNMSMGWYSNEWLIFGLYICPIYFGLGIVPAYYLGYTKKSPLSLPHRIQMFMHSESLILIIIVWILTGLSVKSVFIVVICLLFYAVALLANLILSLHNRPLAWICLHLILQVIPIIMCSHLAHFIFTIFIPILGRAGSTDNPELYISCFTIIVGILSGCFVLPVFSLCRKAKTIICGLLVANVIFVGMLSSPLGFPYTPASSPQRFMVFHSRRIFHNFDKSISRNESGYFLSPMDRHSPSSIKGIVPNMSLARSTREDCLTEIFCGLPLYFANIEKQLNLSYWIPADSPYFNDTTELNLTESIKISDNRTRYFFEMIGPDHMNIFISPLFNAKLLNWSFINKIPLNKNDSYRKSYFIFMVFGKKRTSPFKFFLDFEVPISYKGATFDIAIVGHYTHHNYYYTMEFRSFLKSFPTWAYVTAWTSTFESWRY